MPSARKRLPLIVAGAGALLYAALFVSARLSPSAAAAATPAEDAVGKESAARATPAPAAAPEPTRTEPARVARKKDADSDPDARAAHFSECMQCVANSCASEVAAGGDPRAATCVLFCAKQAPEKLCVLGLRPAAYPHEQNATICGGPAAMTPPTLALMQCGKGCDC